MTVKHLTTQFYIFIRQILVFSHISLLLKQSQHKKMRISNVVTFLQAVTDP